VSIHQYIAPDSGFVALSQFRMPGLTGAALAEPAKVALRRHYDRANTGKDGRMRATMQDVPLSVTTIMRYACEVHGDRTVSTAIGDGGYRTSTYRELGDQVGRLANALRELGVSGDDRVATFMWNNTEHLAAYLAVPSMGAVLHTLNIRLSPEQIAYIANEAEDKVIIADVSLSPQLAPVLPLLETVHTVILVGDGDLVPLTGSGRSAATTKPWPTNHRSSPGRTSSKPTLRPCATRVERRAIRKALSTVTVRAICMP
jgi:acyl-CoA synthetase (AMP-forming)/AMP-acid ligase II